MPTDTTEKGLESLICTVLTGHPCSPSEVGREVQSGVGGLGWIGGHSHDYAREYCLDLVQLSSFLKETQPDAAESLGMFEESHRRRKLLSRLRNEISKRGTVDVLRSGFDHGPRHLDLFYGAPTVGNPGAKVRFEQNRFSVTRQLRYSLDEAQRSLDIGLFINGLPVLTLELKNSLTKQTVADAVEQYRRDRNPRERLFQLGRCVAHFAVDDNEVRFCTHLMGKNSQFLPFNRGWNDGAGNPPNPDGTRSDYLWREVMVPKNLTDILENYAQILEHTDVPAGKTKRTQIWPRYHQLDVVRQLLADVERRGPGCRYLIQHSAGSGKSNSIAWLSHRLIGLEKNGRPIFDSIIVVTDRLILDRQIENTIRQYAQVRATIGHAESSGDLRQFIESGKKIIISTVQKFPFILDEIGNDHREGRFAIIIDEAHSSQGGRTSAAMSTALSEAGQAEEDATFEDRINRLIASRQLLSNASYFAFTATPKNRTLEIFGEADPQPDGAVRHRAFHSYTLKQAIQERFVLDVLANYTPAPSYYRLMKAVEDDPEFDVKKAQKKLRRFVENHDHVIRLKAEIMVDHFHEQALAQNKIGGEARAMVVTDGVQQAIQYYRAIKEYLKERGSRYQAIVAFSGEREHENEKVSEASLNGFASSRIAEKIHENPYRFLVCADKFQTGYDEPLLHTMYVDKTLSGVKAVQTLSRLNRAHPKKHDVFVLDFVNSSNTIQEGFAPYYRTTVLADQTDPNKLHDLQSELDSAQVYSNEQFDDLVRLYLEGAERDQLDSILDACVEIYKSDLDEEGQIVFKSNAKKFVRTYGFLSSILPYANAGWEKRSIFLNLLIPKLPAPSEDDLSRGILDAIDMDSYRVEKKAIQKIILPDEDAEIDPVPMGGGTGRPEPEIDLLSNILKTFNELFGDIQWEDEDRVKQLITNDIPSRVAKDTAFSNARQNSDEENARIEHDEALLRVMTAVIKDDAQLFKQFMDNDGFKHWMTDTIFRIVYGKSASL